MIAKERDVYRYEYRDLRIFSSIELDERGVGQVGETLLSDVYRCNNRAVNGLGGRATTAKILLSGFGRVVIKHYCRGGLFGRFISNRYLRHHTTRGEHEFAVLNRVRALGVPTPEPVFYAYRGTLLYEAWLGTRELENSNTLFHLLKSDDTNGARYTENVAELVRMLILNGIKHVDLHPGNVLVDGTGQVFLLDFDKAFFILNDENSPFLLSLKEQAHAPDSQNMLSSREIMREVLFLRRLRDFYLRRWRRAVIKHGLPDYVSETMCLRLRSIPLLDVGV